MGDPKPATHVKNGLEERPTARETRWMPPRVEPPKARISKESADGVTEVELSGEWKLETSRPTWASALSGARPRKIRFKPVDPLVWDSSLLLFLGEAQAWKAKNGAEIDLTLLPRGMQSLSEELSTSEKASVHQDRADTPLSAIGNATINAFRQTRSILGFVGETVLSIGRVVISPRRFRFMDCIEEMQKCGAMALPIISLISFLVGVTLAYTAAIVLRQFGGDIWVSDLVGLSMAREMGAMMTGVVLAGRTGAAFAAEIGNMGANEEIDALETLGIGPVDFLVLPRVIALGLMMPLLTLYSNALGILGGMVVARGVLDIPPTAYGVEMLTAVDLSDLSVGLIKATSFGMIVGRSGCLRGLLADRSAAGVGRAATSAVVTAILFIIVADAIFAVIFNILGL